MDIIQFANTMLGDPTGLFPSTRFWKRRLWEPMRRSLGSEAITWGGGEKLNGSGLTLIVLEAVIVIYFAAIQGVRFGCICIFHGP